MSDRRKAVFDLAFALLHLAALVAVAVYASVSLARGDTKRFLLIAVLLALYYAFMLHPAVKKEIARRRSLRGRREP